MRVVPVASGAGERVALGCGAAAVGLFALLGLRSPAAFSVALGLLLLALGFAWRPVLAVLAREPLFWAALALFVAVLLRGWIDIATAASHGHEIEPRAVWHHARYGPLLPLLFGLWLAAFWHLRHWCLFGLAVNGLVYYAYRWDSFMARWPGGDGPSTPSAFNEGGLVALTLLFIGAALALAAWLAWQRRERMFAIAGGLLGPTVAALSLVLLLVSQARGAWLALVLVVSGLGAGAGLWAWRCAEPHRRRVLVGAAGTGLLLLIVVGVAAWDLLSARLARDLDTVAVLFDGRLTPTELPSDSFGDRLRLLIQGALDMRDHPLWGVGPASIRDMVHEAWGKPWHGNGDYHNTWINLGVTMGLPWTLAWIGVHGWALVRALRAVLGRQSDAAWALLLLGAVVAHFVALTFTMRIWGGFAGTSIYLLLMVAVFAALLRPRLTGAGPVSPLALGAPSERIP